MKIFFENGIVIVEEQVLYAGNVIGRVVMDYSIYLLNPGRLQKEIDMVRKEYRKWQTQKHINP